MFQSAPLTEARGDNLPSFLCSPYESFNPLPSPKQGETFSIWRAFSGSKSFNPLPSPKQGETNSLGQYRDASWSFNPLPSPKQGETESVGSWRSPLVRFNPLPSPKQGETPWSRKKGASKMSFNPLPSPKQGETEPAWALSPNPFCFNPLPSPKQGETHQGDCARVPPICFNPLPSPKQGETRVRVAYEAALSEFQSAPLTEARGDPDASVRVLYPYLFQSAPLTEARGDLAGAAKVYTSKSCFNPLPSPKQGETGAEGRSGGQKSVSIRSPHRSKGRQPTVFPMFAIRKFQSAPLTEARGDKHRRHHFPSTRSFNPLPSPKQGETHVSISFVNKPYCFNPLPSPKQGETQNTPQ